jgi:hypothetical protein
MSLNLLGLCLANLLPAGGLADDAYLYPETVYAGDIAELVIEYDNRFPSLFALDAAPLEADFEVLDIRSRVFRVTADGEQFHRMQWRLQLLPRNSGRLVVPPLTFGEGTSPRLQLEVSPLPDELAMAAHVFVEVAADPVDPYIDQPVRISTRLFYNTQIGRGRIDEPDADDIIRFRHGHEYDYTETRDGREYRVLERRMAVIGSAAHTLSLSPARYRGRILGDFGAVANARSIDRRSERVELQLRAPPTTYGGRYWLPAQNVELSQHWEQGGDRLVVGDSLGLTLSIVATGLAARSLPENLLVSDSGRFRIYPDRAERTDSFDGDRLVGRLEQRFAIVATEAGLVDLPGLALTWWDVDAERERVSRLDLPDFRVVETVAGQENRRAEQISAGDAGVAGGAIPYWPYWLPFALLVAAAVIRWRWSAALQPYLASLGLGWRRRRALRRLRLACLAGEAQASRALLLEWARLYWPGERGTGLHRLRERFGSGELADELLRLDAALYSAAAAGWQGGRLWRLLRGWLRDSRATRGRGRRKSLPDLYPA